MKMVFQIALLYFLIFSSIACKKNTPGAETRSFYMGVTPWQADFTEAEVNNSYDFINNHCDIVSHHFDDGIPMTSFSKTTRCHPLFYRKYKQEKQKPPQAKKFF
jgi:hypothetical protein